MTDAATYTAQEVAELTRVSAATVRSWVATGKILCTSRLSPRAPVRIPSSEVERLTEGNGMGARYDADRGRWVADFWYHHPEGRRERFRLDSPVNTRRGALAYEQEIRKALAAGTFRRVEPLTVKAYESQWRAWCVRVGLKPSTRSVYDKVARRHVVPAFGPVRFAEIRQDLVNRYVDARRAVGTSDKTINNELLVLASMVKAALDEEIITAKPRIRLLKMQRKPKDRPFRYLKEDEAAKIEAACVGYWRAPIILAIHTGLRKGEIQALRWSDVDLKRGVVRVVRNYFEGEFGTPKSGNNREVPLSATAISVLSNHPRMLRCDLVFHTVGGGVISASDMSKGLYRTCKRAQVEQSGWHVLRHTCASWLVQRGVPLAKVRDIMGHSTIAVTERYAHLSPEVLRDAVSVLDRGQQLGNGTGPKTGTR